jgi:trk system potassium uptake protein
LKGNQLARGGEVLERLRRIVSNLGFFLQITGLLLILPVAIGLQSGELQAVASIVATCFLAFGVGFFFNSFAERKELDEGTSLWLLLLTFMVIPLVLMIPYVWNNVFNSASPFDLFTNSYFETLSGFTTTGFSFVLHPESLPMSLLFYRSLVEFIGGIGFIYILVAFLYPKENLDSFVETFGIEKICDNLRKLFLWLFLIYSFFVVVFTVFFFFTYSSNLVVASCAAIDILTGGYQPNMLPGFGLFQVGILILMLLGSLNFRFHYNLFHLKFRELLTPEIKLFLIIIAVSTVAISFLAWMNPFDSLFHVVSMASSTGIEYTSISATFVPAKVLFMIIGLIGGCAFSMAGGIRVQRVQVLVSAIRKKGDEPTRQELKSVIYFLASFVAVLLIFSFVFSTVGVGFLDSVFEVGSALTTNGISMGATTLALPIGYKWLLIVAMVIGRVELLTIFRAIRGLKE